MVNNILILTAAYLLGSIPFGLLLVKWVKGVDVRTQGSGNIGMTNVWRVAGAKWGIATLLLDISKGALAIWLANHFTANNDLFAVLSGLAVLIGNIFPIFLKFKGGKGIGVSVGVFFSLLPLESTVGLSLFVLAVLATRMISVGSLLGVTAMATLTLYHQGPTWYSGLALFAALMVWWTHRQNIRRIIGGTESKIGKKANKGPGK
jgi:acyl phosphate:glycerol-3-phosphate acyltransferase